MTERERRDEGIKTTDTVFDIVETLQELGGGTTTELADRLDYSKSTVHRHLATLSSREYLVKSGETYELGLRFLELGTFVKNDIRLASVAKPSLEKLAEETGEAVWLIVEEHGCGVYLDNAIGENGFQIETDVGERSYLHYSAAGKALLAHRPRTEVREIIDRRGLPTRTEHTISDPDELLDELDRIRERGFAFNEEEEIIGVHGVGAPICDDEYAIGAIGVGGAANRLNGECFRRELPDLLLGATNEIELRLTYS